MASTINADDGVISGIAGVKTTADSTGALNIQTNGTTAISISATQAVSLTNSPTFTGGTANGVLYLNGSKVATSGTALVFDGTNLGVGTTSPAYPLQVRRAGGAGSLGISIDGVGGTDRTVQYFAIQDSASGVGAGHAFYYRAPSSTTDTLGLLLDEGGNVGIGTTSPGSKLEISASNPVFTIYNTSTGDNGITWESDAAAGASRASLFLNYVNAELRMTAGAGGGSYFQSFYTNGAERMRLDSSGNLGIGTSSPATLLDLGTSTGQKISVYRSATIRYGFGIETDTMRYYVPTGASNAVHSFGQISTTDGTTYTERMRLDSSGNLGLGVSPSVNTIAKAFELQTGFNMFGYVNIGYINANAYYDGGFKYKNTAAAGRYEISDSHKWFSAASGTAGNNISFTQAMTLDASGNLGVGTTSPGSKLEIRNDVAAATSLDTTAIKLYNNSDGGSGIEFSNGVLGKSKISFGVTSTGGGTDDTYLGFSTCVNGGALTERARITSAGIFLVGKTSSNILTAGVELQAGGDAYFTAPGALQYLNRTGTDGTLVEFRQDNTTEGSISVSGTTVSYNGGHLSRWSQIADNTRIPLLKGTVMTNLDQMAVWEKDGQPLPNEQLNCMKVSDVEGDVNVAGVFVNWDNDDDVFTNDMNIAMTGDMIIRIAQGVVVQRGELLMSAGDGTAKPQGDDIIRSKTVAKVTSNHVTCTYDDGSYCVPCVLTAC